MNQLECFFWQAIVIVVMVDWPWVRRRSVRAWWSYQLILRWQAGTACSQKARRILSRQTLRRKKSKPHWNFLITWVNNFDSATSKTLDDVLLMCRFCELYTLEWIELFPPYCVYLNAAYYISTVVYSAYCFVYICLDLHCTSTNIYSMLAHKRVLKRFWARFV